MDDRTQAWFGRRTSRWQDWPHDRLLAAKQRLGVTISVVIPARNEQRTVAAVVSAIARALVKDVPLGGAFKAGLVQLAHAEYIVVEPPRGSAYEPYHGLVDASGDPVAAGIIRLAAR